LTETNLKAEALKAVKVVLEVERQIRTLKAALNTWIYGINKVSLMKNGNLNQAEEITRESTKFWIKNILKWRSKKDSPYEAVMDYIADLDKRLLAKQSDFDVKRENQKLIIKISGGCIHADACRWLTADGLRPTCSRALILATAVEVGCDERYEVKVIERRAGQQCIIELFPKEKSSSNK
jgi:hypothetical protein